MEQAVLERRVRVIPATKPAPASGPRHSGRQRVAAYCRVSTDSEEQLNSYAAQQNYYTQKIEENPDWEMAGIFADDSDIFEPSQKALMNQAVFMIWSNFLSFWASIYGGAEWATFLLPVILREDVEKPPLC